MIFGNIVSSAEASDEEDQQQGLFGEATSRLRRLVGMKSEQQSQQQQQQQQEQKQKQTTDWQLEKKYTLNEVQSHCSLEDCWMVIFDKVYDITDFVYEHPGGDFILLEYAGRDATHPFLSSRHGSLAYKMLDKYWIGILCDEELYYSNNSSYCSVYSSLSWRSTPPSMEDNSQTNTPTTTETTPTTNSETSTTTSINEDEDETTAECESLNSTTSDEGQEELSSLKRVVRTLLAGRLDALALYTRSDERRGKVRVAAPSLA